MESALLQILCTSSERVHQVSTHCRVTLHFAGKDGLDIGEHTINHGGHGLQ